MKIHNKKKLYSLASIVAALLISSCGTKTIVYNPHTGQYAEGSEAKKILKEREVISEANQQARDRELERNNKRRESSRYVTRESVMFGQSVDEFDVLAARDRALQAEADVARVQAENLQAVSRAHKIIDFEKRYERAMGKLDTLEVLPGIRKSD
jgi:hypothetical protein